MRSSYTTLPPLPDAFHWTQEAWGPVMRCLPLLAVAPHGFTTRHLTVSPVAGARELCEVVGRPRVVQVRQVHGRTVVVRRAADGWPDPWPEADAIVTDDPTSAVAVRAADCVPVLIADARLGVVGAAHAGWRGTAASVAPQTIHAMAHAFGSRPQDLVAAIGPCIGACCYEVGTDVVDAFAAAGHERHLIDRWFPATAPPRGSRERGVLRLDLVGATRDQLVLAGVEESNVHACGLCTAMHLDVLTSYRAEGQAAGRLAGVIAPRRVMG